MRGRACVDMVIYRVYTWGRGIYVVYMGIIYKWIIYSTVRHVSFVSGNSFVGCRSRALRFRRAF